jgi:phosphatidylglycerophosphatase A
MKTQGPGEPRPRGAVVALATLGPVGRRLPAPGTWGAAAGLAVYAALFSGLGWEGTAALAAAGAALAVGICGAAEARIGRTDPGEVILDEFVAMPLCLAGWQVWSGVLPAWAVFLAAFGLFRLFDVAKPFGIRRLQALPGGWGIVVDDTAAALAACAVLHAARWAWGAA